MSTIYTNTCKRCSTKFDTMKNCARLCPECENFVKQQEMMNIRVKQNDPIAVAINQAFRLRQLADTMQNESRYMRDARTAQLLSNWVKQLRDSSTKLGELINGKKLEDYKNDDGMGE